MITRILVWLVHLMHRTVADAAIRPRDFARVEELQRASSSMRLVQLLMNLTNSSLWAIVMKQS